MFDIDQEQLQRLVDDFESFEDNRLKELAINAIATLAGPAIINLRVEGSTWEEMAYELDLSESIFVEIRLTDAYYELVKEQIGYRDQLRMDDAIGVSAAFGLNRSDAESIIYGFILETILS